MSDAKKRRWDATVATASPHTGHPEAMSIAPIAAIMLGWALKMPVLSVLLLLTWMVVGLAAEGRRRVFLIGRLEGELPEDIERIYPLNAEYRWRNWEHYLLCEANSYDDLKKMAD